MHKGIPCPILVLGIASCSVSIVVGLNDLGAEVVVAGADPESVLVEAILLVGGRVVLAMSNVLPGEGVGANSGVCALVGGVAAFYETDAEVDVFFLAEGQTTLDEVATGEASH